jgi:hypothetical protein
MPISAWLFLVYCVAVLSQLALRFIIPGGFYLLPNNPSIFVAVLLSGALPEFIFGSIPPMIYWTIRRFRRESTVGVMIAWVAMMGVFVCLQYYGIMQGG